MPILDTEVSWRASAIVNNTGTNGYRMGAANLATLDFGEVNPALRATGGAIYRKVFPHINDSENGSASAGRIWTWAPATGDVSLYWHAGTQTDTQADLTGSEDLYGAGYLETGVAVGATELDVVVRDGTIPIFRDGDTVCIAEVGTAPEDGEYEKATISGTPVVAGDVVTITLAAGLGSGYSTGAYVASILETGAVAAAADTAVVTSTLGTFDVADVVPHNQGAAYEQITLTFSSSTAFAAAGDTITGSLGSGNTTSGITLVDPRNGQTMGTIPAGAFGGTFANGDTVTFWLRPAAWPAWAKLLIEAGAAPFAQNWVIGREFVPVAAP